MAVLPTACQENFTCSLFAQKRNRLQVQYWPCSSSGLSPWLGLSWAFPHAAVLQHESGSLAWNWQCTQHVACVPTASAQLFVKLHFQTSFSLFLESISKLFMNSFCFLEWKLHCWHFCSKCQWCWALAWNAHKFSSDGKRHVLMSSQLSWTFWRQKYSWRQFWGHISPPFLHFSWEHLITVFCHMKLISCIYD